MKEDRRESNEEVKKWFSSSKSLRTIIRWFHIFQDNRGTTITEVIHLNILDQSDHSFGKENSDRQKVEMRDIARPVVKKVPLLLYCQQFFFNKRCNNLWIEVWSSVEVKTRE